MILIYRFIINIIFPFIVIIIFFRTWFNKEDKKRYKEKLFSSSFNIHKNFEKKLIWFHVASIGELKSIAPLIKKLNNENKYNFLITTVTLSSAQLIKKELFNEKNIIHRFFPVDKLKLVKNFIERWSPNLIIFVDSEIWPNFLLEIKIRKIPLILLNGRITKKTFLRWNTVPKIAEKIFKSFDLCLPSSLESKHYLEKFKVKKIKYFGNLKFTSENGLDSLNLDNKKILNNNKFWCAISTHEGEDIFCLKTHLHLKKIYKNIITIIIPRHIYRANDIKKSCDNLTLSSQILSDGELINSDKEVIIINSYGVISKYLKICKSVFIGKSIIKKLSSVGGQNPIEAAKFGCKIYHGPYVQNFKDIYDLLNDYKISETINNDIELSKKLENDFKNLNHIKNDKILIINNLGKKILNDTYRELVNILNK
jgi:3-deoxy-D-manno-octulosonic-acid transferase